MNKRYIDFVPTNGAKGEGGRRSGTLHVQMPETHSAKKPSARVISTKKVARAVPRQAATLATRSRTQARTVSSGVSYYGSSSVRKSSSASKVQAPALGVVEDLNAKFVKTDVPKRPLSNGQKAHTPVVPKQNGELETAKARRIIGRGANKAATSIGSKGTDKEKGKFKTPKSPFINQEKVIKRPLSKNVYQKKVVAAKETQSKPVAIITKPEKESHVGFVIAVIVTIILGAAAGTVAFLLLPK